ncbi:hypothetical protein PMAYCL1PPCAC_25472, partial [Pristionchus mayeri]
SHIRNGDIDVKFKENPSIDHIFLYDLTIDPSVNIQNSVAVWKHCTNFIGESNRPHLNPASLNTSDSAFPVRKSSLALSIPHRRTNDDLP